MICAEHLLIYKLMKQGRNAFGCVYIHGMNSCIVKMKTKAEEKDGIQKE